MKKRMVLLEEEKAKLKQLISNTDILLNIK